MGTASAGDRGDEAVRRAGPQGCHLERGRAATAVRDEAAGG